MMLEKDWGLFPTFPVAVIKIGAAKDEMSAKE
jgi:hypothetical protein